MTYVPAQQLVIEAGIEAAIALVGEFHRKLDVSQRCEFPTQKNEGLRMISQRVLHESKYLEDFLKRGTKDSRVLRNHLHLEEGGEFCEACAEGDEVKAFDALCDLLYVVFGTAEQLDWPLAEGFAEVHRSNMTKEKQPDDAAKDRVRVKGARYEAPDLKTILERYRLSRVRDRENAVSR